MMKGLQTLSSLHKGHNNQNLKVVPDTNKGKQK